MEKLAITLFIIILSCSMITGCIGMKKYEWYASGNAPVLYPTELYSEDFILSNNKRLYIPKSIPYASKWGQTGKTHVLDNNKFPAPAAIDIFWYSWVENKFYSLKSALPLERIRNLLEEIDEESDEPLYQDIIAGMAPYGGLAVWLSGSGITTEVAWLQAEETIVEMKDFAPTVVYTQNEYWDLVLKGFEKAYENYQKNGLPDRMLYERYMQKSNYNISFRFEDEDSVFEEIEAIVFKDKYESYRSPNYIGPQGGWRY